jgi:ribosomal protein S18 acetylase RimI-like enzyme
MDFQIKVNETQGLEKVQSLIQNGVVNAPADVISQTNALYMNTDILIKRMSAGIEKMITAWDGDRCVGAMSYMRTQVQDENRVICSILFIYVDVAYRGQGIAGSMMKRCLLECKNDNVFKLNMSARFSEKRLICLGINYGFRPEGFIDFNNEKFNTVLLGIRP